MAYYNMQGPAQYQQYQQSRKDQQMNQMLQMMMQMRAFKQRQKQFDVGQETSQRAQDWREKYQQQYMDYQQFQMNPERQKAMSRARAEGTTEGKGPELPEPRPILPGRIRAWVKRRHGYTDEQLDTLDDVSMRNLVNEFELETRPEKPTKPTVKPQHEKDYGRIKNLLGRYDKERTRYMSQLPKTEDPQAQFKIKQALTNIDKVVHLLTIWGDSTSQGNQLSEKEQKRFKKLLNMQKIKGGELFLLNEDVPPGVPIASNKQGEQVALIENQWVPILA